MEDKVARKQNAADGELDARKQRILQAVVQDYVATAEPVGSHTLVLRHGLGVKSATLRNEMAEMSERGYLRQPHTSAGRIPSDQGYRFYVDRLMLLPVVPPEEARSVRGAVASASSELDAILRRTCSLLAAMTRLPAVATAPDADDTLLRQVFVSPVGADRVLLVLLFSTGRTENRIVETGRGVDAGEALLLANALNDRLGGRALAALRAEETAVGGEEPPSELRALAVPWSRLRQAVFLAARTLDEEAAVFVEGAHTAVLEQPEFRDVDRLGQFLSTLQERAALIETLQRALDNEREVGSGVRVVIGEEHERPRLQEFSLVSSAYFVGARERGAIAVLGPTRMDYGRAGAAVQFMARTLSDLLTRLSAAP